MKWLLPLFLLASPLIWQWVDSSGIVHITDNINDVPDPYYTIYQKRLEELKAKGQVKVNDQGEATALNDNQPSGYYYSAPTSGSAWDPSSLQNMLQEEEQQKAVWQARVQSNRRYLVDLTGEYARLEQEAKSLSVNPYLAALPQNKSRLAEINTKKSSLLQEIAKVKHRLNSEIPEAARKAGIPPGWLR